ncbi:MAG: chromosome segregation SMC family protein [archaeon]
MAYIKRLVMQGFKSFVRKTEIHFNPGINVILGPNGSGKSNISDALCFVLGRLSIKSIRAAKASNLIFLGTKSASPAKEAMVEVIFDNSDKAFSIEKDEVSIKRIVRKNGQSMYKIENEVKTRQEVLSLLAQAGIDPNGFNLILQGEIQNFVKMHTEERRKVIEEVSGISIYEMRKEKSLKELENTEDKLKEVSAILKERTAYLNNLERERQQALKFKKLENDVKVYKASIINYDLAKKKKEKEQIEENISKRTKETEKLKKIIFSIKEEIESLQGKISLINLSIQKSTGLEQESLNREIANLRAEIAGMNVKVENYENKISQILKQKDELKISLRQSESDIKSLESESPSISKKSKEIETKKKELEELEKERKKYYAFKSEFKSTKERIEDKKSVLQAYTNESDFVLKQISLSSKEISDKNTDEKKVFALRRSLKEKEALLEALRVRELELEKVAYNNEKEIERLNKLVENISRMDICPLCKNKITKEHVGSIKNETSPRIDVFKKEIENSDKEINQIYSKREMIKQSIESTKLEISKRENDLVVLSNVEEKKEQIKSLQEKINKIKEELVEFEKRKKYLESKVEDDTNIDQKCDTLRVEIQEISLRTEKNVDSEVLFKQREVERAKIFLKQLSTDEEDIKEELASLKSSLEEKNKLLNHKKQQEEELIKKFQKMISERDILQSKTRENEIDSAKKQADVYSIEQGTNNIKIDKAKVDAEIENFEMEILEFSDVEMIKLGREILIERLSRTKETLSSIGSVNLRSLEVYDSIKKEYDAVKEKAEIISKEKEGIMRIIQEIDIKKKKTFLKTLTELNELFSKNFSQLSDKGQVWLDIENKKEPFEGGVNITVKTGHGKYFDAASLSGGEQTIVALSLIFAIQELKPYYFYVFDEVDAALDKRNSERLAGLLKKYMRKGQYLVITHNDEMISSGTNLYGISMHDGISKVISLKL